MTDRPDPVTLDQFVRDFAAALQRVDAKRPAAVSSATGWTYQPGIGPHTEAATVALVLADLV